MEAETGATERSPAGSGRWPRYIRDSIWVPTPGAVLVGGMIASAILVFSFGRRASFSGDELSIISQVSRLDPSELIEPYVGHLVPIPLLAYRVVLDLFGTGEYFAFQAMTLLAIFLLAWTLYAWAKERVPPWVAVAPCLLLTIFPQDMLHYLAGNGFTIIFALVCGLAALLAFERNSRGWDVVAFLLIILGMLTYTVAVAFALGILLAALLGTDRRRIWVAGVPLAVYAVWRLTLASASNQIEDVGPDFANLFLLPAWTFQSIGGTLASLIGLEFDFIQPPPETRVDQFIAPGLALLFFGFGAVVVARGMTRRSLVVVSLIALALFASQAAVWGTFPDRPGPAEDRYLYPGALVVVLIGLELVRRVEWTSFRLCAVWAVTGFALLGAIGTLATGNNRASLAGGTRAEVLAITLLASTEDPPELMDQPRSATRLSFDAEDGSKFGYLGFTEEDILGDDSPWGIQVDLFMAESLGLGMYPVPDGVLATNCRWAAARKALGQRRAGLPRDGAILFATQPMTLLLGRYGEKASWGLGPLGVGRPEIVRLKQDDGRKRWFVSPGSESSGSLSDLVVCGYRSTRSPAITSPFPKGLPDPPRRTAIRGTVGPDGP